MSDTSGGPGWWLASDGRWYPPESWTPPPPTPGASPYAHLAAPGTPPFQGAPYAMPRRNNGLAVASLVCSCAGVVPFFFGLPCVLGIVFGFVARSQIRRSGGAQGGEGLALAGIIVGFGLLAIFLVLVIVIAAVANNHTCGNFSTSPCNVQ
jgi:hypothetical protein